MDETADEAAAEAVGSTEMVDSADSTGSSVLDLTPTERVDKKANTTRCHVTKEIRSTHLSSRSRHPAVWQAVARAYYPHQQELPSLV
jgi:hypothetical protein